MEVNEFDFSDDIIRNMMIVSHKLKLIHDNNLVNFNLTLSQIKVLIYIWHNVDKHLNQKQIHEALEIKASSMTKLIEQLIQKDLVVKITDPSDSRNKLIVQTKKGKLLQEKTKSILDELKLEIVYGLSEKEIEQFNNTLKKINENCSKLLEL